MNATFRERQGGGIEFHCYSHDCSLNDVAAALDLSLKDFLPPAAGLNGDRRKEATSVYPYRDEQGRTLFWVGRFTNGTGKKFLQWREDAFGHAIWNLEGVARVLYGVPELLKTRPGDVIFIVEGERDALTVALLGFSATTNPGGAGKWRADYSQWVKEKLPGRKFVLLPDNDQAGAEHAESVRKSLESVGLEARILALPGLQAKGDVTDWVKAGGTAGGLLKLLEPPDPTLDCEFDALVLDGPALLSADIPEPEWLAPGLVARGVMTMLVGIGKLGKSVLAHQLCVAGSTGGVWLGQRLPMERCLYVNFEDPLGLTRSRAVQQFAPVDLPPEYRTIEPPFGVTLNRFLSWLMSYIKREEIRLVVLDPLAIAARWKDENDNMEVGLTCRNIQEVAAKTGAAILVVHHVRKSGGEYGTEVRGGGAIFAGIQGFLSFRRLGEGQYQLDTLDKMPGELGGEKHLLLRREAHTLTWHVEGSVSGIAFSKEAERDQILESIQTHPGITISGLVVALELSQSSVSRRTKELEEEGYIYATTPLRRETDKPNHRPAKEFFATKRSWQLLE